MASYLENRNKVIALYNNLGLKAFFSKIRFWDAPYKFVEQFVPKKGRIVELGCGEGIFSNFMAISSESREVVGMDIDKKRVGEADRGLSNTSFRLGDAVNATLPKEVDCIVMFHLLHHLLSHEDQEKLIRRSVRSLKKGGRIIIVEIDKTPFLKYFVSWLTDHFIVAWLFERKLYESTILFRSKKEWRQLLFNSGLKVKTYSKSHIGKPFSHIVFVCNL